MLPCCLLTKSSLSGSGHVGASPWHSATTRGEVFDELHVRRRFKHAVLVQACSCQYEDVFNDNGFNTYWLANLCVRQRGGASTCPVSCGDTSMRLVTSTASTCLMCLLSLRSSIDWVAPTAIARGLLWCWFGRNPLYVVSCKLQLARDKH